MPACQKIVITPIYPEIVPEVVMLCGDVHAVFASQSTPAMHKAVCRDAARSSAGQLARPIMLVAMLNDRPVGLLAVVTGWAKYWRRFLLKHPILGCHLTLKRLLSNTYSGLRDEMPTAGELPLPEYPPCLDKRWCDSDSSIAKVVFIGVLPDVRGQGVAIKLYDTLADHLHQMGVTRLDARIGAENSSSIRMHEKASFSLYTETPTGVFATRDLST